jgi:hypothetical protein
LASIPIKGTAKRRSIGSHKRSRRNSRVVEKSQRLCLPNIVAYTAIIRLEAVKNFLE